MEIEIEREDLCSLVYNYTQQNREHNVHDTNYKEQHYRQQQQQQQVYNE